MSEPPTTRTDLPHAAPDVIVLGAGIIGVSVAGELGRRGARVRLLDRRGVGRGATQASAGMLAPYTEAEPGTVLSDLCAEALEVYDEVVARVRRDSGQEFDYARTGTVEVALDESSASHFQAAARDLRARGIACAWRDAEATSRAEAALTREALGSLVIDTHGFVAVMGFARALLAAAQAYGVQVTMGTSVTGVCRTSRGLEVVTDRGALQTAHVIVCTGSWSADLTIDGDESPRVYPVRGQLLELRPQVANVPRILWGPRCYLVPWSTGTILVGATVEDVGFDEQTTEAGVSMLRDAAVELVPSLDQATLVDARAGLRPASADGLPIIGPASVPGVVYATGHYRNGVLLAPLTGVIVADLVLDGRRHPALDALSPARFRMHAPR